MVNKIIIGFAFILLIGSVIAIVFPQFNPEPKTELTQSQIQKMIELGVIRIHPDLQENENDKEIGIIYQTQNGDCYLHRDIFGRYYCRW
jgi:hypothetical protein